MAYFGGDRLVNIAVESISIFAALGFLLTVPSVDAVVHYDCAPAGESAAGECLLPDNVAHITRVARCFVRFLTNRGAKIAFKHIKAHDCSFHNEFANAVAKAAAEETVFFSCASFMRPR